MKDVSIRAARLHQTRPLLCPEKASLYQEKSPRSWASAAAMRWSGPAPGDSGRREALGVRAAACVHRGWRGRASACAVRGRGSAPSTRCRLWWGPPPAPSHSGGSGRPPGNTQEDPLASRGPHSPGRASLAAFPAGGTQARRPRTGGGGGGVRPHLPAPDAEGPSSLRVWRLACAGPCHLLPAAAARHLRRGKARRTPTWFPRPLRARFLRRLPSEGHAHASRSAARGCGRHTPLYFLRLPQEPAHDPYCRDEESLADVPRSPGRPTQEQGSDPDLMPAEDASGAFRRSPRKPGGPQERGAPSPGGETGRLL